MALKHYSSWPVLLNELQSEFDDLFQRRLQSFHGGDYFSTEWTPACDLQEEEGSYRLLMDIPGVNPEDIEIYAEDGSLVVKGFKEEKHEEKERNFIASERFSGSFYRKLSMPLDCDWEKVEAKDKNGVLEVFIPRKAVAESKRIPIK